MGWLRLLFDGNGDGDGDGDDDGDGDGEKLSPSKDGVAQVTL